MLLVRRLTWTSWKLRGLSSELHRVLTPTGIGFFSRSWYGKIVVCQLWWWQHGYTYFSEDLHISNYIRANFHVFRTHRELYRIWDTRVHKNTLTLIYIVWFFLTIIFPQIFDGNFEFFFRVVFREFGRAGVLRWVFVIWGVSGHPSKQICVQKNMCHHAHGRENFIDCKILRNQSSTWRVICIRLY